MVFHEVWNEPGITPITLKLSPLRVRLFPTMFGSRAKRLSQKPSERSSTRGAPGLSSPSVKARPMSGAFWRVSNMPDVTWRTLMRSASFPEAVRTKLVLLDPNTASNTWF